jgi:hypothetical protein
VKQQGKWTINRITDSVYIIAKHIHDHQERIVKRGGSKLDDSKVVALLLMYCFFIAEIAVAEVVRQSQKKVPAKSLQQHKSMTVKPLPTNFHYGTSKVCVVFVFFCRSTDISWQRSSHPLYPLGCQIWLSLLQMQGNSPFPHQPQWFEKAEKLVQHLVQEEDVRF